MRDIIETANAEVGTSSNETYDMNVALIDSLSEMEAQSESYRRKERFWLHNGLSIGALPFVTTLAVTYSPIAERFDGRELFAANGFALYGSFVLGVVASLRHSKVKEKGYEIAEAAAPISLTLNRTLQPWITHRLDEKEKAELKLRNT